MKKAVVVGAGLSGLTAGYRLQQAGWQVRVLESSERSGGRIMSAESQGFLLDLGPTLITNNYGEYLKLVHELGLTDRLVDSSAVVGIVSGRELHLIDTSAPLRSFAALKLLSAGEKLALICKGLKLIRPLLGLNPYALSSHVHYDTESMQAYLDRSFGRRLGDALFAAVARGVTLSTPDTASVIEFFAGAVAAAGKMQNLKGGMAVLPDALAARLDLRLSSPVTRVDRDGAAVVVRYRDASSPDSDSGSGEREERADACVITARFRDAAELYPPLRQAGAALYEHTAYTGCYSLQLLYGGLTHKRPFIVLVPHSASPHVSALFLEHEKAPDRAPPNHSQITVFFNLGGEFDFANWSQAQLVEVARNFVESLFPELAGHLQGSQLTRWPYAAHVGSVGYYRALQEFLDGYPADEPVQAAGDYMAVSGQESAVISGVRAAQRLLAAQGRQQPSARA